MLLAIWLMLILHVFERCDGDHPQVIIVPFKPVWRFSDPDPDPDPDPLLHLATNAAGNESSVAMTTAAVSCVNSQQNVLFSSYVVFNAADCSVPP